MTRSPYRWSILWCAVIFLMFPCMNVSAQSEKEIYKYDLMKLNHIEANLGAKYDSVESLVFDLMEEYGVAQDQIGMAFYNFQSDEHFYLNEDRYFIAASTVKAPIAALFIDLIQNQQLALTTPITYKDSYFVEGAGNITNNPLEASYTIEELLYNAVIYSDNTAWYALMDFYNQNYGSYINGILDFTQFYGVPDYFYEDNYASAFLAQQWLIKIATQPNYKYLVSLMSQTEPDQLFTSYVDQGMANKYGRLEDYVHDTGIYFEDGQPQYTLAVYTQGVENADVFLEMVNLRINEWHRHQFLDAKAPSTDVKPGAKPKTLHTDTPSKKKGKKITP